MTAYTFDQLITFTRTSAATHVGSNGLVAVTPASRNLLTYTQEFDNPAWTNDFAASFSGSAATTDNSGSVATNATQMTIGYATSAPTEVLCGHIQHIDYYPTRLTKAQIQALTARGDEHDRLYL